MRTYLPATIVAFCLGGCAPEPAASTAVAPASLQAAAVMDVQVPEAIRRVVAAPDRSAEDRALDGPRRSGQLLAFAGIREGSRVGELGAWEGYTAELLARLVGASGHVFAEDPPEFDKWIHEAWETRAKRPEVAERVTHLWRPFEDPFGSEVHDLAAVFSVMFYHDTVWLHVDRAKMNAAAFAALAPGGEYIVVDHSARPGDGVAVAKTLHRIEERVVVEEVQRAGFALAARADFLRHPEDARDWNAGDEAPADKRGTSDRFVLRFTRP
jgi:predicted methyltransferase